MTKQLDHKQLTALQNNSGQREAIKDFAINVLEEIAIERTFAGQDVVGIPEARKLVDRMFDKLDELYGTPPKVVIQNSK